MKKIISTLIVIYACNLSGYSQQNDMDLATKKWEGLWKGLNGNDSLTLHIIQALGPAEKDLKDKNFVGMYGWHAIKRYSEIIESSLSDGSFKWNDSCTITGALNGTSDTLHLVIKDITRNRLLGAYLILQRDNVAILQTWLKETWRLDGKKYPEGQSFPKEIRLTKFPFRK